MVDDGWSGHPQGDPSMPHKAPASMSYIPAVSREPGARRQYAIRPQVPGVQEAAITGTSSPGDTLPL